MIPSWKRAFEPGFDPESPDYPERIDLTYKQKVWLRRVWTRASTALLGMSEPCLPDAFPRYNEKKGLYHVRAIRPHFHHVALIGESLRLDGDDWYANPKNIVPVSARLHVGRGVWPGDDDEQFVIHEDAMWASRNWGLFLRGEIAINPFIQMHEERREITGRGRGYHNDFADLYLADLGKMVILEYAKVCPNDPWPG